MAGNICDPDLERCHLHGGYYGLPISGDTCMDRTAQFSQYDDVSLGCYPGAVTDIPDNDDAGFRFNGFSPVQISPVKLAGPLGKLHQFLVQCLLAALYPL